MDEAADKMDPARGEWGAKDPYFGYKVAGSSISVEFWIYEAAPEAGREEISMVVERSPDTEPQIIWPPELAGTDIEVVKRKTWPKMYN